MTTVSQKTVSGLIWSFVDALANQGIQFVVGIVLARILSPAEFGLIGMVTIFIAIFNVFIDSGFSQALIRKKDCSAIDYSTAFYFNLFIGIIVYIILFALAPLISLFFKEPQLINIVRILGVVLIINSLSIIQRTILTKNINFKLQTKISIISSVFSGVIAIVLAYIGYGVWSLVIRLILLQGITSFLLWIWNKWQPIIAFSKSSMKEFFRFGSKLLASTMISIAYNNLFYVVIGKLFSSAELGYFTRAQQFNNLPSMTFTKILQRVSYPALSQVQEDSIKLKIGYKKIIVSSTFISFGAMFIMAAVSEPLVISLVGEKWRSSIYMLQLLCFSGVLYPLHAINLNMLKVKGRSDLFLKLELIKKAIAFPITIFTIFISIKAMLISLIFTSIFSYYLNSYWAAKLINYSIKEQIIDILPNLLLFSVVGVTVYFFSIILPLSPILLLITLLLIAGALTYFFAEIFKMEVYFEIKKILILNLKKIRLNGVNRTK